MIRLTAVLLLACAAVKADPLTKLAEARSTSVARKIDQGVAISVLHDWWKATAAGRKEGAPYIVDLREGMKLALLNTTADKRMHYVFGVKTRCAKALSVKGKANTSQRLPATLFAPATTARFAAIRAFFDDTGAACRAPEKGFQLFAVGEPDDQGKLDVIVVDETGSGTASSF